MVRLRAKRVGASPNAFRTGTVVLTTPRCAAVVRRRPVVAVRRNCAAPRRPPRRTGPSVTAIPRAFSTVIAARTPRQCADSEPHRGSLRPERVRKFRPDCSARGQRGVEFREKSRATFGGRGGMKLAAWVEMFHMPRVFGSLFGYGLVLQSGSGDHGGLAERRAASRDVSFHLASRVPKAPLRRFAWRSLRTRRAPGSRAEPSSISVVDFEGRGWRRDERIANLSGEGGFEPSVRLPVHMISNQAPSATRVAAPTVPCSALRACARPVFP